MRVIVFNLSNRFFTLREEAVIIQVPGIGRNPVITVQILYFDHIFSSDQSLIELLPMPSTDVVDLCIRAIEIN